MPQFAPYLRSLMALVVFGMIAGVLSSASPPLYANESEEPRVGQPGEPASEYVVVRKAGHGALALHEATASLEDLGFDRLPVPAGRSAEDYARELRASAEYELAQPDARVQAAATPNDTFFDRDQFGYLNSIGAPAAWDLAVGREEIVVAVLDSGADIAHPDLGPRLWANDRDLPGSGMDEDGNGCVDDRHGCRFVTVTPQNQALCGYQPTDGVATGDVYDDNGLAGSNGHSHGTMVSGVIGAAGNNGQGVSGVAWNIRLMIVKVLDCGDPTGGAPGGQMSDVARGIEYARLMGADIINLSLASQPGDPLANQADLRAAIAAAEEAGIIIVAATGNTGGSDTPGVGYPAAYTEYSNVVAVGASDWRNGHEWAGYSSYGPAVDFAAPGNDITSTIRTDLGFTNPYGKAFEGTSFSTPLVSGMFALMMSRNSRLPVETYIQLAREGATAAPSAPHGGNWAGSGIVNLHGALERIPMLVTGFAMRDWVPVEAGVSVEARIGNRRCGITQTVGFGAASRFELLIDPDAVTADCGSPGATVRLFVDGAASNVELNWPGAPGELVYSSQEPKLVSPAPGALVVQTLVNGWSNIAHLEDAGSVPDALSYLPPGWSSILRWITGEAEFARHIQNAPDFVQTLEGIDAFDAYWVHTNGAANTASVNPEPGPRTIGLEPGWNNFVYTGAAKSVGDALEGISGQYTVVYRYNNSTGTWQSFVPERSRLLNSLGGLLPLQVYWVHATEAVSLEME